MTDDFWAILHREALAGDKKAQQNLMRKLWPIVHHQVGKVLYSLRWLLAGRSLRQEVEELTQQVFVELMDRDWWAFRSWTPSLGRSLPNFIRQFAGWRTIAILRRRVRWPWIDGELGGEEAALSNTEDVRACPEKLAASRELGELIYFEAKRRLSPLGWTMFEMIMIEDRPTEDICRLTDMTQGNVHVWANRLRKLVREIMAELEKNPGEHGS